MSPSPNVTQSSRVPLVANTPELSQPREILKLRQARVQASSKLQFDLAPVLITEDTRERLPVRALLDCGCTKTSIDSSFACCVHLPTRPVLDKCPMCNTNGSLSGYIKELATLRMEMRDTDGNLHHRILKFPLVNLGVKHDLFLSYD